MRRLYSRCQALIWPEAADFGIAPVEVQASGRPVIAYAAGGALETVVSGETGLFFHQQTPAALIAAVRTFDAAHFDPAAIRRHAEQYDVSVFQRRMAEFIDGALADLQQHQEPWVSRNGQQLPGKDGDDSLLHARSESSALGLQTRT